MFENAKWIWCDTCPYPNQHAYFFFDAVIRTVPESAIMHIGAETKYWLFVNGELTVFDGGLFRESIPGCGYYDTVDVAKHLKKGINEITIHVWYYGNGGRNNSFCSSGGLILECNDLGIYTSEDTLCCSDSAYYTPSQEQTSHLYGGDHTAFDARVHPYTLCPSKNDVKTAALICDYADKPFGKLLPRPIPLFDFSDRIPCKYSKNADKLTVKLPYAMHVSPYFKINAKKDTVIDVRTDRYTVNGGPGDSGKYFGHRIEYICRDGEQEFEMSDWIFGEEIIFTIPDTVKVIELGYRESSYPSAAVTTFKCNDPEINLLFKKSVRTLRVCMRENYMDCPDRERGQWIGDVSVQAPQIIHLLDENGLLLLKKSICDFFNLKKGDTLVGNVPGDNFSELPSQSLNAISELGMVAAYYSATSDLDILRLAFEPSVRYLMLWETDTDGAPIPRMGNWEWYDHLYNCDKPILNICWYYSALKFAKTMANNLYDTRFNEFIENRMNAIERCFESRYWNTSLKCYASTDFADDRANAMAVLSGLCPPEHYKNIRYLLMSVFNSSTYMENYVLMALCEMGFKADAFRRMKCRYHLLAENSNSTLWEDFYHLGTKNHAWSGAPATILLRYFAGINPDLSVNKTDISPLTYLKCTFKNKDKKEIIIQKTND